MKAIIPILATILLVGVVTALNPTIPTVALYSPLNNSTFTNPGIEFMFEVQGPEDAQECSLIIDEENIKTYARVPKLANREFKYELDNGTHTWRVDCKIDDIIIESEERIINIKTKDDGTDCYEKVYKGSGTYRYTTNAACLLDGQQISGLRTGDWIEVRLQEASRIEGGRFESTDNFFIVYVMQVTVKNGNDILRFNTNKDLEKIQVGIEESVELDMNDDGQTETNLKVINIEQKKATVEMTLNLEPEPEQVIEEPQIEEEEVIPIVIDEPEDKPDPVIEEPPEQEVKDDGKGKFWMTIIIIIILAIIVLYLSLSQKKEAKKPRLKTVSRRKNTEFMIDIQDKKKDKKKSKKKKR